MENPALTSGFSKAPIGTQLSLLPSEQPTWLFNQMEIVREYGPLGSCNHRVFWKVSNPCRMDSRTAHPNTSKKCNRPCTLSVSAYLPFTAPINLAAPDATNRTVPHRKMKTRETTSSLVITPQCLGKIWEPAGAAFKAQQNCRLLLTGPMSY